MRMKSTRHSGAWQPRKPGHGLKKTAVDPKECDWRKCYGKQLARIAENDMEG